MSIIMRDGKYMNADPSEEDKKIELKAIGARITARRLEAEKVVEEITQERQKEKDLPKRKKKSTRVLLRTQTVLKKALAAWPSRKDLRELVQEVDEVIIADNFNTHTKIFVKILSVLETVIPLWSGKQMLQLTQLQKLIRLLNEKERKRTTPKASSVNVKTKTHLTKGDIDRWVEAAKKGDRLIYYTGHTFDTKEYQEQKVFAHVRDLCFNFAPIANNKKFYTNKGASGTDWGVKYHNIITLIQQKVVPQQKDKEKNIISHAIYNYIMEKL
jgi:hypothetical protein